MMGFFTPHSGTSGLPRRGNGALVNPPGGALRRSAATSASSPQAPRESWGQRGPTVVWRPDCPIVEEAMKESRHRLMSVVSFSLTLLFAGSSVPALAPATGLQDLGRSAPSIVQGHVVKLRYARNADESLIYTWVTMKVH